TVKRRLDVNIAQGAPIIEHYRKAGIVSDIQGNQEIDAVFADIEKAIAAMK
ncbi:adenylate kinase, partial [Streptococcus suis]